MDKAITITLPLNDITLDDRLQMRESLNFVVIDDYAECIFDLPPGKIVVGPLGEHWLIDGWHTWHAHMKAGAKEMKCNIVRHGTFMDALVEACGANSTHGLPRTQADKRRSIRALLSQPLWRDRSDRVIATACRVSHPLVSQVRKEMESTGNFTSCDEDKRTGADGKARQKPTQTPTKQDDGYVPWNKEEPGENGHPAGNSEPSSEQTHTNGKPGKKHGTAPKNGKPGKAPKTTPDDADDEMVDDADYPIPARLRAIFGEKDTIRKLKSLADQSYNILIDMEKKDWYKKTRGEFKGTDDRFNISNSSVMVVLANTMKQCEPLTVHQECHGDGCPDCKQRGYMVHEMKIGGGHGK